MLRLAVCITAGMLCLGCSKQSPTTGEPQAAAPAAETPSAPTASIVATPLEPEKPLEALDFEGAKPDLTVSLTDPPGVAASEEPLKGPMPVHVSPFYNSVGPQINVGDYSQELTDATAETIGQLTDKMKATWLTLSPETMYATSIRLYDLGLKDDAVYWFYAAQFRARLFQSLLVKESIGRIGAEGLERAKAYGAFYTSAGKYINGYGFGNLEKLEATIARVKDDNQELPQFKTINPRLVFIDEAEWPAHRQEIAAGLDKFVVYIKDNADMIKANRAEKGTDKKY